MTTNTVISDEQEVTRFVNYWCITDEDTEPLSASCKAIMRQELVALLARREQRGYDIGSATAQFDATAQVPASTTDVTIMCCPHCAKRVMNGEPIEMSTQRVEG